MPMRARWMVLVGLGISCAQELPSSVPLGRGPLAEEDHPATSRKSTADRRQVASAQRPARKPEPSRERPPEPEPSDAGVADGAPADGAGADAASSSTDAAKDKEPTPVLAGRYEGPDVTIFRISGLPERSEKDPKAKTDVEEKSRRKLAITLVNSLDGTPICTLDADLQDHGLATIPAGQSCFGGGDTTATLSSGNARFAGPKLTLELKLDIEVEFGDEQRTGEIEYSFEGTRR